MRPDKTYQSLNYFASSRVTQQPESEIGALIDIGAAVLVPASNSKAFFQAGRVAIASDIYERYVIWTSAAMRNTQMWLEEDDRLQALLKDAHAVKRHASPAYFTHKGVASDIGSGIAHRFGLKLMHYDKKIETDWLITR
jgi:hypothetical protein